MREFCFRYQEKTAHKRLQTTPTMKFATLFSCFNSDFHDKAAPKKIDDDFVSQNPKTDTTSNQQELCASKTPKIKNAIVLSCFNTDFHTNTSYILCERSASETKKRLHTKGFRQHQKWNLRQFSHVSTLIFKTKTAPNNIDANFVSRKPENRHHFKPTRILSFKTQKIRRPCSGVWDPSSIILSVLLTFYRR